MGAKEMLLIDGDRSFADLVTRVFSSEKLNVDWSPTAEDATSKAMESKPDFIMIDVDLPDAYGFALFSSLKKKKVLKNTKFIISGDGIEEKTFSDHAKLRRHADAYMHKPLSMGTLKNLLINEFGVVLPPIAMEDMNATGANETTATTGDDAILDELDSLLGDVDNGSTSNPADEDADLSELDSMLGMGDEPSEKIAVPPPLPESSELEETIVSSEPDFAIERVSEDSTDFAGADILDDITPQEMIRFADEVKSNSESGTIVLPGSFDELARSSEPPRSVDSDYEMDSTFDDGFDLDSELKELDSEMETSIEEPLAESLDSVDEIAETVDTEQIVDEPGDEESNALAEAEDADRPETKPYEEKSEPTAEIEDDDAEIIEFADDVSSADLESAIPDDVASTLDALGENDSEQQNIESLTDELLAARDEQQNKKAVAQEKLQAEIEVISEQINSLKSEKDELATANDKLAESLRKAEAVSRSKAEESASASLKAEKLEAMLEERDDTIRSLRSRLEGHDQELEELKERLAADNESVAGKLTLAEQALEELGQKKDKELEDLCDQLDSLRDKSDSELENLRLQNTEIAAERDESSLKIENLESRLSDLENNLDESRIKHDKQVADFENQRDEMIRLHEQSLEEMKRQHESQLSKLSLQIDELIATQEKTKQQRDSLDEELQTSHESLSKAEKELREHIDSSEEHSAKQQNEIEKLVEMNRRNEERVIKAYRKIKADAELRSRSEKALKIAMEIVKSNDG